MNCQEILRLLAEGKPLDAQAAAHGAACQECSALLAAWNEDLGAPSTKSMEAITAQLGREFKVVRPLPSNAALVGIGVGVFLALSLVVASITGFGALSVLRLGQIVPYYAAVLILAVLYARASITQMIPGSKRLAPSYLVSVLAVGLLGVLLFAVFRNRSTDHFVSQGIPCLRLGTLSALLAGLVGWPLFRKGYYVSPRQAITLFGFFSGLAGIAVLALHCPISNSLHFLVWHIGAMLLAGFAGFFLGSLLERSSYAN